MGEKEGQKGEARKAKDRGEMGCIGMLRGRQVTPRWADDTVHRHAGEGGVGSGGGFPPHKGIRRRDERAGRAK